MREAIVVLGMHRSGTSMVSGMLKIMGLDPGKNLWAPDHANVKGYFENSRLGVFNDELLGMVHATWYDTLSMPDRWWLDEKITAQIGRFSEIIGEEFDATSFLLFKDPRISVLVPFYIMAFEKLNIRPLFIINFRDPSEVAASLRKRNNMAISKSFLLWMDYTLKAEWYTRGQSRIFLRYDHVLANPSVSLKKIFRHFTLNYDLPPAYAKRIGEFVDKELNHHSGLQDAEKECVPEEVKNLYDLVCSLNGKDTNAPETEKVDIIGTAFYSECRFYRGIDDTFEALLQVESTSGKRKTYARPIHAGYNKLEFSIDPKAPVTRIILNPCNQRTGVIIHKAVITSDTGGQSEIFPSYSNADWKEHDGCLVFESETPEINYYLEAPVIVTNVAFSLTYLVFADPVYRFAIEQRNDFITELSNREKESAEQIRKDTREIEDLKPKIQSGLEELDRVKTEHAKKEEEYRQAISFSRGEIETMTALITKNEEAYKAAIESGQSEIRTLTDTLKKLETVYQESVNSRQQEIDLLTRQLEKSESQGRLVIASKQKEIESLSASIAKLDVAYQESIKSGRDKIEQLTRQLAENETRNKHDIKAGEKEIRRMASLVQQTREEMSLALDRKQQELSELHDRLSKQETEFAGVKEGLNRELKKVREEYEQELARFRTMLAEKEYEKAVIMNSYTWKTGKAILTPLQLLRKRD